MGATSDFMRFGWILAVMVGFSAVVGCSAGQPREAIDPSTDPAWIPPGQGDLAIGPDPEPKAAPKPKRARSLQQPNAPLHARSAAR